MSTSENKLIVQRYIEQIINTGNVDRVEQHISPEYVQVYEGKRYALGIQGAKQPR